jgi:hypothetical protein
MIPFLKKKQEDGYSPALTIKTRTPDKPEENQEDDHAGRHAAAKDLMSAIQTGDIKGIADALQAAFEIMDSEPHEEGLHIEPHSYDAQKED